MKSFEKRLEAVEKKLTPPMVPLILHDWTNLELRLAEDAGLIRKGRHVLNFVLYDRKDADWKPLPARDQTECRPLDELKAELEGIDHAKK